MLDDVVFCFYGKLLRISGIMRRWAAGAKVLHVGNGKMITNIFEIYAQKFTASNIEVSALLTHFSGRFTDYPRYSEYYA